MRADAVTDCTRLTQRGTEYAVTSGATTTCTCADAVRHGHLCKHGFAVLLVRALRREANKPRCHLAEHLAYGAGYAVVRRQGQIAFWPGTSHREIRCTPEDLTAFGPVASPPVWR